MNVFRIPEINGIPIIQIQSELFILYFILYILLIIISLYEYKFKLILDKLTLPGMLIGLILSAIFDSSNFISHLLGVFGMSVPLLIGTLVYYRFTKNEGLGLGAIKLSAMIGSFIGVSNALICLAITLIIIIPYIIMMHLFYEESSVEVGPLMSISAILCTLVPFTTILKSF